MILDTRDKIVPDNKISLDMAQQYNQYAYNGWVTYKVLEMATTSEDDNHIILLSYASYGSCLIWLRDAYLSSTWYFRFWRSLVKYSCECFRPVMEDS